MTQQVGARWCFRAVASPFRSPLQDSTLLSRRPVPHKPTYRRPFSQQRRLRPSLRPLHLLSPSALPLRRSFASTARLSHGDLIPPRPGEERRVTFVDREGRENSFVVADGNNLLDIAQANELEMEGACGGSCACSTCHVIVESDDMYERMGEASDDENDMLDLAFGLTETSRLGCQVEMKPELDGLVVKLPSMTRNMQASDFAEKKA